MHYHRRNLGRKFNMEELKLIVETINGLGENATQAFIWWLLIKYLGAYIQTIVIVGGIFLTASYVTLKLVGIFSFASKVGDTIGCYPPFAKYEREKILLNLKRFLDKEGIE